MTNKNGEGLLIPLRTDVLAALSVEYFKEHVRLQDHQKGNKDQG